MNIRAKVYGGGGGASPDDEIVQAKKPKGAKTVSLDSVAVPRETARSTNSRYEDRHRLLDEYVQLTHGGVTRDVQLINLSGGGAMISGDFDLPLWDNAELHLGEEGTIECVVRWIRGNRFGLEFAHETRIDCSASQQAAVLREVVRRTFPDVEFEIGEETPQPENDGPEGRAESRHPLVWSGVLHHDYQSSPVRLRNISATGVMIECSAPLRVGSEPLLELSEALSVSATVAWVTGDQAGLRFHTPFDLQDLANTRPELAEAHWEPPTYLVTGASDESPWSDHWKRLSLGELKQQLDGFLGR
jgi:hypothetical protein